MDWKDLLKQKLEKLGVTIEDLFAPPFGWSEITIFLKAAIEIAEEFYPEADSGRTKLQLVMEIWDYYDTEYQLVEQLDDMVDFKKLLGSMLGTIVEQFDSTVIRAIVEQVIIPILVGQLFPKFL